jgi:hypothetical protein
LVEPFDAEWDHGGSCGEFARVCGSSDSKGKGDTDKDEEENENKEEQVGRKASMGRGASKGGGASKAGGGKGVGGHGGDTLHNDMGNAYLEGGDYDPRLAQHIKVSQEGM